MKATRLEGADRVIQLLECCKEQLRKDLTRNVGGILTEMTEEEVFRVMKTLVIVREENTMVARMTLTLCTFRARLRGQASVCKFTQQCPGCETSVDYTEAGRAV